LTVTLRASAMRMALPSGSRRADIIRHLRGEPIDRNGDRLCEADDQHIGGETGGRIAILVHAEDEPSVAVFDAGLEARSDRISPASGGRKPHSQGDHDGKPAARSCRGPANIW